MMFSEGVLRAISGRTKPSSWAYTAFIPYTALGMSSRGRYLRREDEHYSTTGVRLLPSAPVRSRDDLVLAERCRLQLTWFRPS